MMSSIDTGRSRHGVTPVVAIVLLLMMTVAAAGGAFAWYQQMQEGVMQDVNTRLNTRLDVKDIQCTGAPINTAKLVIKNDGKQGISADNIDFFMRDASGHINVSYGGMDWNTLCSGPSCAFERPGGLDTLTIDVNTADAAFSQFLVPGTYYTVEFDIGGGITVDAGSCVPE